MKTFKCIVCNKEFKRSDRTNNRTKYCSRKCLDKLYRKSKTYKDYLKRNRERLNEYSREFYKKDPLRYRKKRLEYEHTEKGRELRRQQYYKNKTRVLIRKYTRDHCIKAERCQRCNSAIELQIHHISYEPIVYIILCRKCHTEEHKRRCLTL